MNKVQTLIEGAKNVVQKDVQFISVLDLGCGPALYWKEVYSHFKIAMITGVDFRSDQDMCFEEQNNSFTQTMAEIKRNCDSYQLDFKFVHSEVATFAKNTNIAYDLIVCFQILSLLNKDEAKLLLSDFRRILNGPGLIALCIPNVNFSLKSIEDWPSGIPDSSRNKFNLNLDQFIDFVQEYRIAYHIENGEYHWAILSCT